MVTHDFVEDRYLDYIEGVLSPSDRALVEGHIEDCAMCREAFKQYRALYLMEAGNDLSIPELDDSFTNDVMSALSTDAIPESFRKRSRRLISGLLATNVVLSIVLLLMIGSRSSLLGVPQLNSSATTSPAALPSGYRQVALHLDPEVRTVSLKTDAPMFVDLRVVYEVEGSTKIAEVLRFAKVVAVHENRDQPQSQPVLKVLVKEEDVERVNLARILGDLSVSMFTTGNDATDDLRDPEGRQVELPSSPLRSAVLYQTPENTKIPIRKVFDQGTWREDPGTELLAF